MTDREASTWRSILTYVQNTARAAQDDPGRVLVTLKVLGSRVPPYRPMGTLVARKRLRDEPQPPDVRESLEEMLTIPAIFRRP